MSSPGNREGTRSRARISWRVVDAMIGLGGALPEIADALDRSSEQLERACRRAHGVGFAVYRGKKGPAQLPLRTRLALLNKQVKIALAGDPTMLTWLGQQYLGQVDRREPPMRMTYDSEADVLMIELVERRRGVAFEKASAGVYLGWTGEERLVAVQILEASKRAPQELLDQLRDGE